MKINIFIPFLLFFSTFSFAQVTFSGDFTGKGLIYSEEESPFWMHSNQRGRVNEKTNVSAVLSGLATYTLTNSARFSVGVGALYQDGYLNNLKLDESYLRFENSWLAITLGRKQREELYKGLSASNENILWSLNARPMPGISFKTTKPIYILKNAGLAFQASLEEFITDDERYVMDTRIHHKSFYLIFDKIPNIEFTVGFEHFAQWAGTSPVFGKLPNSFEDYINVFTGKEGSDDVEGQEANALGNHLGSYVGGIKTSINNYNVEIVYNHLFDDGSGRSLANTPDGRYGIFISDQEQGNWIDAFMYEFYYTKNQSKNSPTTDGADNYFNNNLYRSGWTYENRILGVPFIFLDSDRFRIINNKLVAHHMGISGHAFSRVPYRFLTSYRKNYGAKGAGHIRNNILSTYLDLNVYQNIVQVNLQLGADFISDDSPNFGAGIQLSKSLF